MKQVRICLIGAGRAGRVHATNLARRIPHARLAAICDANAEQLAQAGREFEVDALFADFRDAVANTDIDAVLIVTPTFLHAKVACAAAQHGKHVFLEKPMALSVEECSRIRQAASQATVKLQIGFMRRFDESFRRAREIVASGELGRVMIIKSTGRGPGGPGPWMWDLNQSNGIIAEVNSHDIDSLHWFTQSQVARVYAEAHNFKMPEAKQQFSDFYDNVVATFRFEDDSIGIVDGTCPAHYGYDARMEILCEKGVVMVGSASRNGVEYVAVEAGLRGDAIGSWRTLFKDAYLAEMESFVDCILNDCPPAITGEDGLEAVRCVLAVNESIRTCAPVEIDREPSL